MPRLEESHANLVDRLDEAKEQGWLGEVAAIETTMAAAAQKLEAMRAPERHAWGHRPRIGGYRAVVTGSGARPLLFLDVDGPLIPFGAPSGQYPIYPSDDDSPAASSNPLLARVDPGHGPRLTALPCDLVWSTTWGAEANECLSPRLGLPQLPVVDWPEPPEYERQDGRDGLHWKTRALVDWAAGLPFAWVDDEITDADRKWVRTHHRAPALLQRVDPQHGLVDADYTALAEWLKRLKCIAADVGVQY
ncbi:hypothetical protein ACFWMR_08755 [Amycolatopsis thailandensis]|uniref:hypothetical protein n=1 Tax=Amycolatopsis thailandensis TaxID=589330 RepID=UPI00366096EF